MHNGDNGHKTVAELGLRKEIGSGAERLLRALIRRGLTPEAYPAAAALVRVLDEGAKS